MEHHPLFWIGLALILTVVLLFLFGVGSSGGSSADELECDGILCLPSPFPTSLAGVQKLKIREILDLDKSGLS